MRYICMFVTVIYSATIDTDVIIVVIVRQCRNIYGFAVITFFAFASFLTFFFASCIFDYGPISEIVAELVDGLFLARKFFAASGAVNNAIVASGSGAGSFDSVFFNCCAGSVIKLCNRFLCYGNGSASGALLTISQSGRGATCGCAGKRYFSMVELVDGLFLARKLFAASGAVNNAIVASGRGASGFNSVFFNCSSFGVTGSRNYRTFIDNLAAILANGFAGVAFCGTSSCNSIYSGFIDVLASGGFCFALIDNLNSGDSCLTVGFVSGVTNAKGYRGSIYYNKITGCNIFAF